MKTAGVLCLLAGWLTACNYGGKPNTAKPGIFTDTVAYTYKTIHQRAADCGNKADSACTLVEIRYPEFKDMPILNDSIRLKSAGIFSVREKADTSLSDLTSHFLSSYTADVAPGNRSGVVYRLNINVKVIDQDSALVALQLNGQTYLGGAHGATYTGFINWNPKQGAPVTLDDIFIANYKDKLTAIAERIFRHDEKLKDTSSLARDYFFKASKFALNHNYSITPTGIRFVYNEYEIKPYAAGQTDLFIPYGKIKTLIRPQSVVAHYIKQDAGI